MELIVLIIPEPPYHFRLSLQIVRYELVIRRNPPLSRLSLNHWAPENFRWTFLQSNIFIENRKNAQDKLLTMRVREVTSLAFSYHPFRPSTNHMTFPGCLEA